MGNSSLKPKMTSTSIPTSAYPITKTTIATTSTSSTLSLDDNIVAIIKNATEGLPLAALTIFPREYYLHVKITL
jgi:hypothetical protein